MNPPKPPPTKKDQVRTAASDKRFSSWAMFTAGFIAVQVVVWFDTGTISNVYAVVAYLLGSAATFAAMRSK